MFRNLTTTPVRSTADVRDFFDNCAPAYSEQHGKPERLLEYRISLVRQYAKPSSEDVVLDVGCGNGHHLMALAGEVRRGIGIDISPAMIEQAKARLRSSPWQDKLTFLSDNGEEIATIAEESIDLAICIGALEHMIDKAAVLTNVYKKLKPQGRFFCLTLHGDYLWYQTLAPLLGLETKHLSTDRLLKRDEIVRLLAEAGFSRIQVGYWTFIPKGDMPSILGFFLQGLDAIARSFRINSLRGGLWACAWKDE